jgi:hypothetical protein
MSKRCLMATKIYGVKSPKRVSVKSAVLPAVQYYRHCLATQNTASHGFAVTTRAVQSVSTTADRQH